MYCYCMKIHTRGNKNELSLIEKKEHPMYFRFFWLSFTCVFSHHSEICANHFWKQHLVTFLIWKKGISLDRLRLVALKTNYKSASVKNCLQIENKWVRRQTKPGNKWCKNVNAYYNVSFNVITYFFNYWELKWVWIIVNQLVLGCKIKLSCRFYFGVSWSRRRYKCKNSNLFVVVPLWSQLVQTINQQKVYPDQHYPAYKHRGHRLYLPWSIRTFMFN